MLVEIQYLDDEGSVCPYCGKPLSVGAPARWAGTSVEGYNIKIYPCVCPYGHMTFVCTETYITEDEYIFSRRMFAYYQDWEDHVEMTITAGAYEIPYLDNEDDAWLITRQAVESTQEQK